MAKKPKNELACTGLYCRTIVDPGQGVQWIDGKGELQRYCFRCYSKLFIEKDLHERDHDKR